MNRGLSAESPNAARNLLMAAFRLLSKSTKVSVGQIWHCRLVSGHQFARPLQEQLPDLERLVLQLDAHTLLPKHTRARVHLEDSKS